MTTTTTPETATKKKTAQKKPPSFNGGVPVVGVLPWMRRDALGLLSAAHAASGDVVNLDFGVRNVTLLADPAAVERVLVSHVNNYVKQTRGYDILRKLLGNGLVTSEGSFWLRQRRIAQPAFHKEKIAGFGATMLGCTDDMLAKWSTTHLRDGQPFDVDKEMMALTMRIAGLTLLSTDVDDKASDVGAALTEMVEHQVMNRLTLPFDLPMGVPIPMNRRFNKAKKILDDIVFAIIAARRAGEQKPDLLTMLMSATDEETGEGMSDAQLRDELLTLFLAGHETTASSLGFTLWLLANHKDIADKAREEVDRVIGKDGVADGAGMVAAVMRMPYLDAIFSEQMRLLPPIALLARKCVDGDVIDGHVIGKGDLIFIAPWVTQRHPRWWKDPLTFDPTRFLDGGEHGQEGRPKYAYFPFAGGPRKCIGDVFARLEQKIVLARLLQKTTFNSLPTPAVEPMLTVSLRARHGIPMTVAQR